MFIHQSASGHFNPLKALIAFVLTYAMMVQGIAPHFASSWQQADALHTLCLSESNTLSPDRSPVDHAPDHTRHAPCCLIFGNGDLPPIIKLVSTLVFQLTIAVFPLAEFSRHPNKQIIYSSALPRAPPRTG